MRALLTVFLLAAAGPAAVADEVRPSNPPYAELTFETKGKKEWATTYELTTVSGAAYELRIEYGARGNMYAMDTLKAMLAANWVAEPGERGYVRLSGARGKDGKTDAITSLLVTNRLIAGMGTLTQAEAVGKVKVETKEDDGKGKPDPARKPRPAGPNFGKESFVEFDFSTLPPGAENLDWKVNWEIRTTAGKNEPWLTSGVDISSLGAAENLAEWMEFELPDVGFRAEVVGKTKVRVYGAVWGGRYYPATKGYVTSPNLTEKQLPKVTQAVKDL